MIYSSFERDDPGWSTTERYDCKGGSLTQTCDDVAQCNSKISVQWLTACSLMSIGCQNNCWEYLLLTAHVFHKRDHIVVRFMI